MKKEKSSKQSIKTVNNGFTLIELLVVVLIIGILAAIALPQYQKVMEKSKASQALTWIKSIYESIESYYLATGTYPNNFEQIDIELPESFNGNATFVNNGMCFGKSNGDWTVSLEKYPDESAVILYIARISGKYKGSGFFIGYAFPNYVSIPARKIMCMERTKGSNYLFDSNLPEGAFCEKIIGAVDPDTDGYTRWYFMD